MRVKVQSCTKELRTTAQGTEYTGIKINSQWYNIQGDHRNLYNKEVDLEIKGKWAKLLTPPAPAAAPSAAQHGKPLAWFDYIQAMRDAHAVALELEPDIPTGDTGVQDRSQARAALVDTMLIAVSNGKVALVEFGDEGEEPDEETPPF